MKNKMILIFILTGMLFGCSPKEKDAFDFKELSYSELVEVNEIEDGVYIFVREDCLACHELFELLEELPQEDRDRLESDTTIYKIDLVSFSLEEKAEIVHKFGSEFVPTILRFKNNEKIFEQIGDFSEDTISDIFERLLKGE